MDEMAIVKLARRGEKEALRLLYDQNKTRIFSLAFQYAKNKEDAEDILQETFVKAYRFLDKFNLEKGTSFSAWIYRIGINSSVDYLRRHRKGKQMISEIDDLEIVPSDDAAFNPENLRHKKEIKEKIDQVLNGLSGRQRMVFILRHYQDLSTKEIAGYMKTTEGSVKKQLSRAVSVVRESLKSLITESKYEMQKV